MSDTLVRAIRTVPDFPEPGIHFKDLTPILANADLFEEALSLLTRPFLESSVTHVVGMESRGFWFGPAIANRLGAGFVPARKPGKLPVATLSESYQLEYGTDTMEVHADAFGDNPSDARVLIHDDVIATGGTAGAVSRLVQRSGATIVACSFVIELAGLNGRRKLQPDVRVESLIHLE